MSVGPRLRNLYMYMCEHLKHCLPCAALTKHLAPVISTNTTVPWAGYRCQAAATIDQDLSRLEELRFIVLSISSLKWVSLG